MKVAYLSIMAPPGEPAVSGVHKVSETLLRQYESVPDLEVDVLTLTDGLEAERTELRGSVRYHYIPCKPRGKTATFYVVESHLLKKRVRALAPDIVHGQPSVEYLLAATGCARPHVITLHGLVMKETAGMSLLNPWLFANAVREWLHRRAVRRAENIISISPYVDDYLTGRTCAAVHHVANPIDREFFDVPPPNRDGLRLICVGAVYERKNQTLLVEACRRLRQRGIDFECRIIGRITPGFDRRILDMTVRYGLEKNVVLRGMVSRAELLGEYAWSNAVVLPSLEETSPLSLIQGMASGRCVFGAKSAGIPILLEGGKHGTLFGTDSEMDLAACLKDFSADPGPHWERAGSGRARALAVFEPSAVARQTIGVYREILSAAAREA